MGIKTETILNCSRLHSMSVRYLTITEDCLDIITWRTCLKCYALTAYFTRWLDYNCPLLAKPDLVLLLKLKVWWGHYVMVTKETHLKNVGFMITRNTEIAILNNNILTYFPDIV